MAIAYLPWLDVYDQSWKSSTVGLEWSGLFCELDCLALLFIQTQVWVEDWSTMMS